MLLLRKSARKDILVKKQWEGRTGGRGGQRKVRPHFLGCGCAGKRNEKEEISGGICEEKSGQKSEEAR